MAFYPGIVSIMCLVHCAVYTVQHVNKANRIAGECCFCNFEDNKLIICCTHIYKLSRRPVRVFSVWIPGGWSFAKLIVAVNCFIFIGPVESGEVCGPCEPYDSKEAARCATQIHTASLPVFRYTQCVLHTLGVSNGCLGRNVAMKNLEFSRHKKWWLPRIQIVCQIKFTNLKLLIFENQIVCLLREINGVIKRRQRKLEELWKLNCWLWF